MYMDISIKSVEFICFILSCHKFCLFAHLADLDLLQGACQLFHLARNVFVPNGERLHLVFPLSRWFIISCYFSSAIVCWFSSIMRLADAITPTACLSCLFFSLPYLFIFVQQHVPSTAQFATWLSEVAVTWCFEIINVYFPFSVSALFLLTSDWKSVLAKVASRQWFDLKSFLCTKGSCLSRRWSVFIFPKPLLALVSSAPEMPSS